MLSYGRYLPSSQASHVYHDDIQSRRQQGPESDGSRRGKSAGHASGHDAADPVRFTGGRDVRRSPHVTRDKRVPGILVVLLIAGCLGLAAWLILTNAR